MNRKQKSDLSDADRKLMEAFYAAALFLKAKCQYEGWQPSLNYLREHVRCASGLRFTNTKSPQVLRALLREHPELDFLGPLLGTLKQPKQPTLFPTHIPRKKND